MPDKAGKLECTPKEVITEGIMDRVLSANQTSPKYRFMVFRIPNDLIRERGDGASPAVTCTIYVRFASAGRGLFADGSLPPFAFSLPSVIDKIHSCCEKDVPAFFAGPTKHSAPTLTICLLTQWGVYYL